MNRFKNFWSQQNTLEKQLFWIIIIIGNIITFASTIITIIENLGIFASVCSCICSAFMIAILIIAYKFKKQHQCYIAMCYFLNCVLLPITFFSCGGIDSGMMLYFIVSIFLCTPCLKGKLKIITFAVSLIFLTSSVIISAFYPQLVSGINLRESYIDIVSSFVLTSLCIFIISSKILGTYEKEKKKTDDLLKQLDIISKKDALTGLYNRRVLFDYMESDIINNPENYYVIMFDIDNFKNINDTYGHLFGDKALIEITKKIIEVSDEKSGEIAARYGGEEFVYIIYSDSVDNAYNKADKLRKDISEIIWDENPDLKITISGGFAVCREYENVTDMMKHAYDGLYSAKANGKNKIIDLNKLPV